MNNSILTRISESFYQLSEAERRVADRIMKNPTGVQYMSITELAEEAGVGDATVTRFCCRLGLSGFYAFKLELARGEAEQSDGEVDGVVKGALEDATNALNATAQRLSETDVYRVAGKMGSAERVLCAGVGGSMLIAAECAHLFSTVNPRVFATPDVHLQIMSLAAMKQGDVLILFSYSGATKSGLDLLSYAKKQGINTVLITGFEKSPLGKQADTVLCCAAHEAPYQSGSMPARMAQLLIVDALFRAYCDIHKESGENAARIVEALSDQHI